MRIAKFSIALYLFCHSYTTFAQVELPSANDLKASYCIAVLNWRISLSAKIIDQLGSTSSSNETQTSAATSLQQNIVMKRRLVLYLTSRISHLHTDGVAIAMRRGEEDVAEFSSTSYITKHWECTGACVKKEKNESDQQNCVKGCSAASPVAVRIQSCNKLDWLP